MTWKRKAAAAASALLFAAGGMLVTASPAVADGPCPANRICIWDQPNFKGNRVLSGSTNSCFRSHSFPFSSIVSYDNNLSVDAIVWHYNGVEYKAARTLVAGKFSSNIGDPDLAFHYRDQVCMG
ncbi:hypothetical protein GCM10022224_035540 [Nonomuraea antimicrobica]|uniref:Peptidase inhibitor family I36 n=1 Tax=Nonomuraea antimicrobica TaxID=561173 RepID=A0ABP7BUC1_9ACTN